MLYVFSFRTLMMASMMLLATALFSSYSFAAALAPQQNVHSGALSYREWKNSKIQDAKLKVKSIKDKIEVDPNLPRKNGGSEAGLNQDLERGILNLSLTQDLTISDYFVGYLTKQSSMDRSIKDVSRRLTAEEVAEMMSAYAQQVFQTRPTTLKATPRDDSGL